MPIYEYECSRCGCRSEFLQGVSDEPVKKCLECGRHQLKRLVSLTSFRLKGKGWYETDEKNKSVKEKDKGDKPERGEEPAISKKVDQKKTDASVKKGTKDDESN